MEGNNNIFKFCGRPGEDFELWSARTEAVLKAQGVFDVVTVNVMGTISEDQPLTGAVKPNVAKSRAIIMQGLDSKPLKVCLSERRNLLAMWKRLRDRYAISNVSTQVQLQTKLNRLEYSTQVMTDFVDEFEEIFSRLDGNGCSLPENIQVPMFLSSFGEKNQSSYGPIVAALQTAAGDLNWEIVTARMLQE